jgi:hypothetical protein
MAEDIVYHKDTPHILEDLTTSVTYRVKMWIRAEANSLWKFALKPLISGMSSFYFQIALTQNFSNWSHVNRTYFTQNHLISIVMDFCTFFLFTV